MVQVFKMRTKMPTPDLTITNLDKGIVFSLSADDGYTKDLEFPKYGITAKLFKMRFNPVWLILEAAIEDIVGTHHDLWIVCEENADIKIFTTCTIIEHGGLLIIESDISDFMQAFMDNSSHLRSTFRAYCIEHDLLHFLKKELILDEYKVYAKHKVFKKNTEKYWKNGQFFSQSLQVRVDCRRYGEKNDIQNVQSLLAKMEQEDIEQIKYVGIDEENTVQATIAQIKNLLIEMNAFGLQVYEKKWAIEQQIKNATTKNEIEELIKQNEAD